MHIRPPPAARVDKKEIHKPRTKHLDNVRRAVPCMSGAVEGGKREERGSTVGSRKHVSGWPNRG